ncbi:hypothetical protein NECAME_15507 [Necator americanus]|uniref:Uncharacterized protein n=1 Tax=Necator americanus TaxID=51031 RepID=W2SHN1_NECAM|nr:hypothetical protein NECAME_15507 [Necator americanus]ETN69110.1 hypothetical protein NECAME_15507 [Necator americanus]
MQKPYKGEPVFNIDGENIFQLLLARLRCLYKRESILEGFLDDQRMLRNGKTVYYLAEEQPNN